MNLQFKDKMTEKSFSLGTYSTNFLNKNDVFDKADKQANNTAERIFWFDKEGCIDVSRKSVIASNNPKLREDLRKKIRKFAEFLLNCTEIEAYIK